jgi:hypothetical protein
MPGRIDNAAFREGNIYLTIEDLDWGLQRGLPFELGDENQRTALPEGSKFVVRLPEEEGGVWLNDFGAPAAWACSTKPAALKILGLKRLKAIPSPACFAVFADSDCYSVAAHRRCLPCLLYWKQQENL